MTAMMTLWGVFQPLGLLIAGPALSTSGVVPSSSGSRFRRSR
jgi:hypothetical protein